MTCVQNSVTGAENVKSVFNNKNYHMEKPRLFGAFLCPNLEDIAIFVHHHIVGDV